MNVACRRFVLCVLIWLACAAGVLAASDWPPRTGLDEAVDRALAGMQTEITPLPERSMSEPRSVSVGSLGGFFELLTWLVVVAAVAVVITVVVQRVADRKRRRRTPTEGEREDVLASAPVAYVIPESAAAAAARGDYAEALRLLLRDALPRFYRGSAGAWPPSWTSRSCLRRVPADEPARPELAALVAAVEQHHFGGRPVHAADWDSWRVRAPRLLVTPAEPGS